MEYLSPKLLNWASILDQVTRQQAFTSSKMDFIQPYLALMPDAHLGKGATVGSVIPTVGAIMPAAVGVDIGCGMSCVQTQWTEAEFRDRPNTLAELRAKIESVIPLSAGGYNQQITKSAQDRIDFLRELAGNRASLYDAQKNPWEYQLGSLGSGNHFIEVTVDETGRVWLFLHSGSRGIGNRTASGHIDIAIEQCKNMKLPDKDLSYLVEGTAEFADYIEDLEWCQDFALLNRREMMDRLIGAVEWYMGRPILPGETVSCHHNYTEKIEGGIERFAPVPVYDDFWLSRKGAIDASEGVLGLIPGSMGTASYVVRGKGNPWSLNSAPHGAGRVHSRGSAKRTFTLEQLAASMEGIEFNLSEAFLDEHPGAYKDVDVVMADAADLVSIEHTLHQIVNVKGY